MEILNAQTKDAKRSSKKKKTLIRLASITQVLLFSMISRNIGVAAM